MHRRRPSIPILAVTLVSALALVASPALANSGRKRNVCSLKSVNGSYGFYRTGNTPDGPLAALGIFTFDGRGHASGSQSISRNGDYNFDISFDFLYEVNDDCTGRGLTTDGDEFFRLVAMDDGKTM